MSFIAIAILSQLGGALLGAALAFLLFYKWWKS